MPYPTPVSGPCLQKHCPSEDSAVSPSSSSQLSPAQPWAHSLASIWAQAQPIPTPVVPGTASGCTAPGFRFISAVQMCCFTRPECYFLCQQFTLESNERFSSWISGNYSVLLHCRLVCIASLGVLPCEFMVTLAFFLFGSLCTGACF